MPAFTDKFLPVQGGVVNRETGEFYPYYVIQMTGSSAIGQFIPPITQEGGYFVHSISLSVSINSREGTITRYLQVVSTDPTHSIWQVLAAVPIHAPSSSTETTYSNSLYFDLDVTCHSEFGLELSMVEVADADGISATIVVADIPVEY